MWRKEVPVAKIPAGQAITMPDYKKNWYCDDIENCLVRFRLKDKNGTTLSEDHVWPKGLGYLKASDQPNL